MTNQRGQALVETGIVILGLVLLLIGIVEMGRAWMILNMITHALGDGARMAAIAPRTSRDQDGMLTPVAVQAVRTKVLDEIGNVMEQSNVTSVDVTGTVTRS